MTLENTPSEGCSKPKSEIARSNSGFKRKSLESCETRKTKIHVHDLPEAGGVNTRKILFLLVAIVASACSGRSTDTMWDNVVLVLIVDKIFVIVGHAGS